MDKMTVRALTEACEELRRAERALKTDVPADARKHVLWALALLEAVLAKVPADPRKNVLWARELLEAVLAGLGGRTYGDRG